MTGRCCSPMQVTQKEITTHKEMGVPLNVYMLHNLAHVELNAIDLAWDTVVRFAPLRDTLGDGFFADFARVADDESRHFRWYSQRLAELGFRLVTQRMQHQLLAFLRFLSMNVCTLWTAMVICQFTIFCGGNVQSPQVMFLHDWQ